MFVGSQVRIDTGVFTGAATVDEAGRCARASFSFFLSKGTGAGSQGGCQGVWGSFRPV